MKTLASRLFLGTILSSIILSAETGLSSAAPSHHLRHVTPSHRAAPGTPTKPRSRRTSMMASSEESVGVRGSRSARNSGGGMMRVETAPYAVQSVGRQYIEMRSPTSTGLDVVQNLPSVSIAMPDTSGIKGGALYMRGFTDADTALLLDGAPASLAAYLQQNVDAENIETVTMTPGSSPIDAPASNATAGTLDERTRTPGKKAGGSMDFSYGTNNMSREFVRLESGEIGNSGIRSYISVSNTHSRQWMGAGTNRRTHVDVGVFKEFTNGSTVKFFGSWNNSMFTIDAYPDAQTFYNYKHTGQGYNRTNVWDRNSTSAGNYWQGNIDSWNQFFVTTQAHIVINKRLTFDLSPYFATGFGWDGSTAGTPASTGATYFYGNGQKADPSTPLSTYWAQHWSPQVGLVAKLGYDIDRHNHLSFGYWYENNAVDYFFPTMATQSSGRNAKTNDNAYKLYTADGQEAIYRYDAGYELNSFFIEDTAKYFNDRLTINGGFKYIMSNYWDRASGLSKFTIGANSTAPLPHLSISYKIDSHSQVYMNAEGDFRQPSPSQLSGSTSLPKNQYSITEQIGYRYNNRYLTFDISAFNSNITNRLLTTYLPNTAYAVSNAGNQTIRGFDAMIAGRDFHHFSPYASVEYLHGTFDSNIPYGDTYLPTKGKQSILTPRVLANFGLTYSNAGFFGNFSLHYTGPQSVTLVGDQRMPGFVTNTLALGYHFKPLYFLRTPTFRLNFSNLTGSIIRVGTTGITNNYHNVTLLDGSTLAGSNGASFYVLPRFSMTGTISSDF
ncbi:MULTISPECIES: TonB-dependent receptor [unclassified Gluconobacter]|uniref:TonB-dependent receptor n=1 Tax=unclassified Gluconobacter TaxID=2644261 RepID=UPI0019224133|nr:TonB-dependent receptor [Gluconobacter sp. Gdi]